MPQTTCCATWGYHKQWPHECLPAPHRRGPSWPHVEVWCHRCLSHLKPLAKPLEDDLAGPVPWRAGTAVLACLVTGLGGRRMLLGKGCGGPSGSSGSLLCKWAGGPWLCWPPRQPVAPGNASFCLCLEGTQQKRAAKSRWTFYGQLLVTFPAQFFWSEECR